MRLWKRAEPSGDTGGEVPGYLDLVPVGHGGFGVVYRAHQAQLGRTVAVKVLAAATGDEAALARFRRECKLTARLTGHPNVVTVLDTGMSRAGRPFVVTEFFEPGSLKQRLDDRGPFLVDEVLRIGVKVAGALAAAHAAGILHRDVKAENILMSRYGEPALADFGVARLLDSGEPSTRGDALTPCHAAPEVLAGRPPSPSSDTYALASTLYQLLAGHSAYQREADEPIAAVLRRILWEDPPEIARADVPEEVRSVVRRALAKSPAERFRDPLAFAEALQRLQAELGQAVTELPVSRPAAEPPEPARTPGARPGEAFGVSPVPPVSDATTDPFRRIRAGNEGATPELPEVAVTMLRPGRQTATRPPATTPPRRRLRAAGLAGAAVVTAALTAAALWATVLRPDDPGTAPPAAGSGGSPVAGTTASQSASPTTPSSTGRPTPSPTAAGPSIGAVVGDEPSPAVADPEPTTPAGPGPGTNPPASGMQDCPSGEVCIWPGADYAGRRYSYDYLEEDWNWHDGVIPAPANQDFSWFNHTSGPQVLQIYAFGGAHRGALRVPSICLPPGAFLASSATAGGQGSGHLFQQECHPDSKVIA